MNIAYLISAHTDPPQLARLVGALSTGGDTHFFIHIDKKSDIRPFVEALAATNPHHSNTDDNVHFLHQRVDVRWGTINEWDYQLALLRTALAYPLSFHRLVTLSGLDYPLMSNEGIQAFFAAHEDEEQLAAMPLREELPSADIFRQIRPYITLPLIGNRTAQCISIALRRLIALTGHRRSFTFPVGGELWREYKGAAWWAISEPLANYVVTTYDRHAPELRRQFRHQHCPAETLLQTIVFNGPTSLTSRCKLFPSTPASTLAQKTLLHHIDYGQAIRIWTADDLPLLLATGKMFARKFTSSQSLPLISLLDTLRLNPHPSSPAPTP